ncbi:MAG TPA: ribose-5-phosphate isomerase RpiA [Polyangia bacterium]|jgi:ribose 5-phosphate isomerase A|nr:ribose-5-phosphate isomerase RpiA [Polyangia bacterium]
MSDQERAAKIEAARQSLTYVQPGMTIGLGSGTTAAEMVRLLGERVRAGLSVRGVASSTGTETLAREAGIPLVAIGEIDTLDVTIDGADEVDPKGRMIKGRGGALLREKILASCSRKLVIIVDPRKQVATLGAAPVPVEVTPFGVAFVSRALVAMGGKPELRAAAGGGPYVTDGGNHILDCAFGPIPDPDALGARLDGVVGVVEHGLFVGFSPAIVVGGTKT